MVRTAGIGKWALRTYKRYIKRQLFNMLFNVVLP